MTAARTTPLGRTWTMGIAGPCGCDMPSLPGWVLRLVAGGAERLEGRTGSLIVRSIDAGAAAVVEARVAGAVELDAGALIDSARSAYSAIVERLRTLEAQHPVRFWNFIPGIQAPLGPGLSRYMVFNAGRFAALRGVRAAPGTGEDVLLPTATGVGHHQRDLLVCCLALASPGKPVEN